jgi:pyridoxamine 5'-phosphate oxidase
LNSSIASMRGRHTGEGLSEEDIDPDPLRQFQAWMQDAIDAGVELPSAMTLATVSSAGTPSARMVLLKGLEDDGFVFFTNYSSRKSRELDSNPNAALVFYWDSLHRQVRVEGAVERLPAAASDEYWASRPLESRYGAYASHQSRPISGRDELERDMAKAREDLGEDAARPGFWGGYLLRPEAIEFWHGRPDRLHDRLVYRRDAGGWNVGRLSP